MTDIPFSSTAASFLPEDQWHHLPWRPRRPCLWGFYPTPKPSVTEDRTGSWVTERVGRVPGEDISSIQPEVRGHGGEERRISWPLMSVEVNQWTFRAYENPHISGKCLTFPCLIRCRFCCLPLHPLALESNQVDSNQTRLESHGCPVSIHSSTSTYVPTAESRTVVKQLFLLKRSLIDST